MKLYVIVRKGLSTGAMAAQAIHAFRAFVGEHPTLEKTWHEEHNNIVVLHEPDLEQLVGRLQAKGYRLSQFREPDLGNALTAICVEPDAWKQLSSLPLAA